MSEENKSNVIANRKAELVQSIITSQNQQYYSDLNTKLWDKTTMNVSDEIVTDSFFEVLDRHISY
ncbi:MAG: hypothetical protein II571_02365 [Lachnospiraceae bacterium]|nr:hypothetical protein [Lachnospiraceae bacterium]